MAGDVRHMGGLTNPRPWRRSCRAGYSNTGGPPLPRKRAPLANFRTSKKTFLGYNFVKNVFFLHFARIIEKSTF